MWGKTLPSLYPSQKGEMVGIHCVPTLSGQLTHIIATWFPTSKKWWIFLFLYMQAWPPRCTPNAMIFFGISTWDPNIYPVSPTPPYPTSLLVSTFPFCLLGLSPGLPIVTWMSDRDSIASARIAKYPLQYRIHCSAPVKSCEKPMW